MQRRTFLHTTAAIATLGAMPAGRAAQAMDAAAFHAARRYAALDCGRIAYIDRGEGAEVLMLHGFPLNGFQWRGVIERLSPYRRCIAPDFLGLGYTEVAEGASVTPEAQVDMMVALLDKLSIRSVDLIANDSGGAVAQILMVRHPERVRSVLLTNCDTEHDCPPPALKPVIDMARAGTFADQWFVPWLANKTLARSAEGLGGMCYADPAHPSDEALECYLGPLVSTPRRKTMMHAYAIALERNWLADIGPALKASKIPVRVLWGMADTIFSPSNADYFETAFGHSKGVLRLGQRKLFWPEERPDLVAAEAMQLSAK